MKKLLISLMSLYISLSIVTYVPCIESDIFYTYDEFNRILRIEKPDTFIIEYTYDEVGNRTSKMITLQPSNNPI